MPLKKREKIKFACIEYSTKSGTIWRPSLGKPNYLCDPEKEIDPTSFGCWTEALGGEHIPVSYLRIGKNTHSGAYKLTRALDLFWEKINKKPIYHNLNYIKKFNLILLLVHSFSMPLVANLICKLKRIHPKALYLGSIDSPLGKLREVWKKNKEYRAFKTFADHCNLFINVNRVAQDYLEYITKTKVIYLPQFYPFAYAFQFFKPRKKKEKTILVAGETERTDNLAGQLVAIQIQKKYPEFLIQIVKYPKLNVAPLAMAKAHFEVIPFLEWRENLKRLSQFFLVINLDATWTLGRLQSDCASVGTPSIGLNSNNQMEFFPKLSLSDIQETREAVILAQKLIREEKFYQAVQEEAREKIDQSNYENSCKRLKEIIENYQHCQ